MDVSSSLSGPKEFRIVKRGYDPDEVDAFLDQIALGVAELKRKLAEANDAAASAPPAAAPAPVPVADDRVDEIQRALILASRAADEELRKANEEAESIRTEARATADEARRRADADVAAERTAIEVEISRRREEGRTGLLAEISELESVRDSLAGDVVVLERHVDEQREVVQAAIGELQSLLDHPEAFRIAMASGVTAAIPAPALAVDEPPAVADEVFAPPAQDLDPVHDQVVEPEPEPSAVAEEPMAAGSAEDPAPVTPQDLVAAAHDEPATQEPRPAVPEASGAAESNGPAPNDGDPSGGDAPAARAAAGPDETVDESGPPTEAVSSVGDPDSEDAFLAELRKAMLDDEPLGPREQGELDLRRSEPDPDDDPGRGRSRFGRRR